MEAEVVADDVEVAWKGLTVSIPVGIPDPSRQDYLSFYLGCILTLVAGIFFSYIGILGLGGLLLVAFGNILCGILCRKKKISFCQRSTNEGV